MSGLIKTNNIVRVVFFLNVFVSTIVFAGTPLLDKFHGDTLDTCRIGAMCTKENKASCISVHRKAFASCDPLFYKFPESNKYTDCVVMATIQELTKIRQRIDYAKCNNLPKEVYKSEATNPIDDPQKFEYFTDNSLDFNNLQLYGSAADACEAGINRLKKLAEKDGSMLVTYNITKVSSFNNSSGGSEYYRHIFYTPAYKTGDCLGTASTTVLKSNGVYKKGEVIPSKYRDRIFVAVQCHKEPLHESCANKIKEIN